MEMFSRLKKIWQQDRRYAARYFMVIFGSMFIHMVLGLLFAVKGWQHFVWMNVGSLVFYIGWLVAFSKRRVNALMLLLLYADVLIHSCVYNLAMGRGPAFFLYPVVSIPVAFFLSGEDLKQQHTILVSAGLALLAAISMMLTLSGGPKPLYAAPGADILFFRTNLLVCVVLISVYTIEFMTDTMWIQNSLSRHAQSDQLTGLYNRYGFFKEMERFRSDQYCVVMSDIDGFKQINDLYGHAVGDRMLTEIAKVLSTSVRREDIVCRWGGEEFLMVIQSDLKTTRAVVDRIRRKLCAVAVQTKTAAVTATMTFGLADCQEAETLDDLVQIADRNLLRGKRSGKNCAVVSAKNGETGVNIPVHDSKLDTSFLDERLFSAFAATAENAYIYVCNMSTNVSRWSRTAVDYFGLPGEYMFDAGNVWLGFIHPDDRHAYSEDIDAVLSGRKHFHDIAYRVRNRDGEYVRVVCKGVVTEGDATHPALFAGIITNLGIDTSAPDLQG